MTSPGALPQAGGPLLARSVVLRGGTLQASDLAKALEKAEQELERPGISVYSSPAGTAKQILTSSPIPHPLISQTTAGTLRSVGFQIAKTLKHPNHYTVWFSLNWSETSEISIFRLAFAAPIPRGQL